MKLTGHTGKSLSEALLFAEYGENICCVQKLFWMSKTISVHNMFSKSSELKIFMNWTCNSINNLLSYCGLIDAKIRASEKDLPVVMIKTVWQILNIYALHAITGNGNDANQLKSIWKNSWNHIKTYFWRVLVIWNLCAPP